MIEDVHIAMLYATPFHSPQLVMRDVYFNAVFHSNIDNLHAPHFTAYVTKTLCMRFVLLMFLFN